MSQLLTAEMITVLPLDTKKFSLYVKESMIKLKNNSFEFTTFKAYPEAMLWGIDNIVIDNECCYNQYNKTVSSFGESINEDYFHGVSIFTETLTKYDSETQTKQYKTQHEFNFMLPLSKFSEFSLPAVSLREFMGSRFRYNPRIIQNTRDLIESLKSCGYNGESMQVL